MITAPARGLYKDDQSYFRDFIRTTKGEQPIEVPDILASNLALWTDNPDNPGYSRINAALLKAKVNERLLEVGSTTRVTNVYDNVYLRVSFSRYPRRDSERRSAITIGTWFNSLLYQVPDDMRVSTQAIYNAAANHMAVQESSKFIADKGIYTECLIAAWLYENGRFRSSEKNFPNGKPSVFR